MLVADIAGSGADKRTICTIGSARVDGSWLWRIEARRLARGFSVVISDIDSGGRWRLATSASPYTWRHFAEILLHWREHASRIGHRVDFSWIPGESTPTEMVVGESGIVAAILRLCFSDRESSSAHWVLAQSDASIAALNDALADPPSDPGLKALADIVDGIEELQLPADLPALLRHYGIADVGRGFVTLRERITKDMADLLAVREARVAKFQAQIATLAQDIDDTPIRVAGMGFPSRRARLIEYLKDFVAHNDALPTGTYELSPSESVNLDELRRKQGLLRDA